MVSSGIFNLVASKKEIITKKHMMGLELWTKKANGCTVTIPRYGDNIRFVGILTKSPCVVRVHYRRSKHNWEKEHLCDKPLQHKQLEDNLHVYYLEDVIGAGRAHCFECNVLILKYYVLWEFISWDYFSATCADEPCIYVNRTHDKQKIIVNGKQDQLNMDIKKPLLLGVKLDGEFLDNIDKIELSSYEHPTGKNTYDNIYMKYIDKIINPSDHTGYSISFVHNSRGYLPVLGPSYMKITYRKRGPDNVVTIDYDLCDKIIEIDDSLL